MVLILFLASAAGLSQSSEEPSRNTVSMGMGVALPQGRFAQFDRFLTRPALLVDYEFRLHRYVALAAGLNLVFRTDNERCFAPRGCPPPTAPGQAWLIPFGARLLCPLRNNTAELWLGGGGAKAHYDFFDARGGSIGWGSQADGGFRVKFGSRRRWHAGVLGRYCRIPNEIYLKEQWVMFFGTVGVAF